MFDCVRVFVKMMVTLITRCSLVKNFHVSGNNLLDDSVVEAMPLFYSTLLKVVDTVGTVDSFLQHAPAFVVKSN